MLLPHFHSPDASDAGCGVFGEKRRMTQSISLINPAIIKEMTKVKK